MLIPQALFSMPLFPHTFYLWIAYVGCLVIAVVGTLHFARRPELLENLFELKHSRSTVGNTG